MSTFDPYSHTTAFRSLVRSFLNHRLAANLVTIAVLVIGIISAGRLTTQFFPTIEVPVISISVRWAGANADDVSRAILDRIDPAVRYIAGVDEVSSNAFDGYARVRLTFVEGTDMKRALTDVEQAINGVTGLPEEADVPLVTRNRFYEQVARVLFSGPFPEQSLLNYARNIRDELLNRGVEKIDFSGFRPDELQVEISQFRLQELDLTLDDVSRRIAAGNRDEPLGELDGDSQRQLRYRGRDASAAGIRSITLRSNPDGEHIRVGDVGTVRRTFDSNSVYVTSRGDRAVILNIQRSGKGDAVEAFEIVSSYVEEIRETLPPTLTLEIFDARARYVKDRLQLLTRNGIIGFVLVCLVLLLFLNSRIAFWVAVGIPVSLFATCFIMLLTGQSLNAISLVGLIMVLGIVAHDSILIGEHTATLWQSGLKASDAALRAVLRMAGNVLAATITTLLAFSAMFLIKGVIGQIMFAIPLVVISALIASAGECLFMLPAHLKHSLNSFSERRRSIAAFCWRVSDSLSAPMRSGFSKIFDIFRFNAIRPLSGLAVRYRYVTVAIALTCTLLTAGMFQGGRVSFTFFPVPEPESVTAKLSFVPGISEQTISDAVLAIETTAYEVEKMMSADRDDPRIIVMTYARFGTSGSFRGDNVAEITIQLTPGENRSVRTPDFIRTWRRSLPKIPALEQISIAARRGGPRGSDVDIQLKGSDPLTLKQAAIQLIRKLEKYRGLEGVGDDLPWGKNELVLQLTARGKSLGFSARELASQIRAQTQGVIAQKLANGDEELIVRVQLEEQLTGLAGLYTIPVRSPTGSMIDLREVVTIQERPAFSVIARRDGEVSINVSANVDEDISTADAVIEDITLNLMPEIVLDYGVSYAFRGRSELQTRTLGDLKVGIILALIGIFGVLALTFENYWQPAAIMISLPFTLLGVVVGHSIMGFSITILSMIGFLGLLGMAVNDSIVLIDRANERVRFGEKILDALPEAAVDRLRALTISLLTDIGGLAPLMLDKSLQAQFLIPMAITLVFGLAASTLITLFLLPAIIGIFHDCRRGLGLLNHHGVADASGRDLDLRKGELPTSGR